MRGRILAGLFICSLFLVVGGDAQSPNIPDKPVWTLEFIKVPPENVGPALAYLNDHWMRTRAEDKRRGAVLDYHLISNAGITSGHGEWDEDSIVLLTKYKNMDAYLESTSAAHQNGAIRYLAPDTQGFVPQVVVRPRSAEDPLHTQAFIEEPETSTELKLPTKR